MVCVARGPRRGTVGHLQAQLREPSVHAMAAHPRAPLLCFFCPSTHPYPSTHLSGVNASDEREQALCQLLTLMDGLTTSEEPGVLVMGTATFFLL